MWSLLNLPLTTRTTSASLHLRPTLTSAFPLCIPPGPWLHSSLLGGGLKKNQLPGLIWAPRVAANGHRGWQKGQLCNIYKRCSCPKTRYSPAWPIPAAERCCRGSFSVWLKEGSDLACSCGDLNLTFRSPGDERELIKKKKAHAWGQTGFRTINHFTSIICL